MDQTPEQPLVTGADPQAEATDLEALADLLGVLAYGSLTASIRMCVDADAAPGLSVKSALVGLAADEYRHYEAVIARMVALGIDHEAAMQPFVAPLASYHERTRPKTWLEGLVKAYVGEGIAKDFYGEVAKFVDADTRAVIHAALVRERQEDLVVDVVRTAMKTDPQVSGRLALWGRRLVGEALSQAQAVAVERDPLAMLLIGGADLAELGRMFGRLTDAHRARMARLGLDA